jgi:hypothetical protein
MENLESTRNCMCRSVAVKIIETKRLKRPCSIFLPLNALTYKHLHLHYYHVNERSNSDKE